MISRLYLPGWKGNIKGKEKMATKMKLSIIMPCYNVESTISRALDSVLMQKVNFDYEIIIVNDASTDRTLSIIEKYKQKYSQFVLISNTVNCGNARSFYNGLNQAKGDYFCVLDGDDYYTINDKLQRQVDFLDNDNSNEYVGVCSYYVVDLGEDKVSIPTRLEKKEFSYVDFLTQNSGYYHTSTYVYRNIFRGNVPEYFKMNLYRGDTPRTTFHLMYSGKKIRVLDFVGSAYTFEFNGIWSSLKEKEQFQYQVSYLKAHKRNISTQFEEKSIDKLIEYNSEKLKNASEHVRRYPSASIQECIEKIKKYEDRVAFSEKEFMLEGCYYSEYLDTLCASLGYIKRIHNEELKQKMINKDSICIINGVLNPKGGGIFAEISQLIEAYSDKKVYLFVTNMDELPEGTVKIVNKHNNVVLIFPPKEDPEKLVFFMQKFVEISPYRAYFYCSHNDVYAQLLIDSSGCENVCLFSFDHGYLSGISNPNLGTIVAKRPVDYYFLKNRFREKVIYIPTWDNSIKNKIFPQYVPFSEHQHLITACGAARFYKVDGRYPYRYIDYITELLKRTDGIHYHYGPIDDKTLSEIYDSLEKNGINHAHFVNIPWAENLSLDLIKRKVDVFIEPFPVVSYKLTLNVLAAGIPVFCFDGIKRLSITDFVPENTPKWRNQAQFVAKLLLMNSDSLAALSKNNIKYYESTHSADVVIPHLRDNRSFPPPTQIWCSDDTITDISGSLRLFGNSFRINVMA